MKLDKSKRRADNLKASSRRIENASFQPHGVRLLDLAGSKPIRDMILKRLATDVGYCRRALRHYAWRHRLEPLDVMLRNFLTKSNNCALAQHECIRYRRQLRSANAGIVGLLSTVKKSANVSNQGG